MGFSGGSAGKKKKKENPHEMQESVCIADTGFNPQVGKIPWRRKWQPTPVFLPGKSIDQGAW